MKIAIVTSPFGPLPPSALGAVERRWFYVANHMRKLGHDITFYSKADSRYDKADANIVQIKGYGRSQSFLVVLWLDFLYSVKALFLLRKCDILVMNTFWLPALFPLFRWKYKRSVYNVARMPKGQFFLYPFVSQFSCVSKAVQMALTQEIGEDPRIVTVCNPLNLEYFKYSEPMASRPVATVTYHGRVHREKGLDLLAKACQQLSSHYKIKLTIIGPHEIEKGGSGDAYIDELRALCPNVEIIFQGSISDPRNLNEALSQCCIYCYPSVADMGETFGVSPLEAMGTGRPVIVSALDCFKDFIEDGVTGLIFDHHAEDAANRLAQCIERLIQDDGLRRRLGKAAYEKAQEFSVGNIAEQYLCNFEKLLSK